MKKYNWYVNYSDDVSHTYDVPEFFYIIILMLTDEKMFNLVRMTNSKWTVICGDLDSLCLLSYESNKVLKHFTFESNTTTTVSIKESEFRFVEISAYIESTRLVWDLSYTGMLLCDALHELLDQSVFCM